MTVAFVRSSVGIVTTLTTYGPDNAAFDYTDCCAVSTTSVRTRFSRPTVDGQGFETANPGARVRFITNAGYVQIRLRYTNLVTRQDTYNAVGLVLVDGAVATTFSRGKGPSGPLTIIRSLGITTERTIEIVMPYCASVDFEGIDVPSGSTVRAPSPRSPVRMVAMGDSITHGFYASDVRGWAYRLAVSKGWEIVNHGYGGRSCQAADGTTLAALSPTVAIYLIGYNDFYPQVALATFRTKYDGFLTNFRASNTTAKLYCITPTWTSTVGAITVEQYRQEIRDSLTAAGNALNILVEGEPLATNSTASFPDGIHPNDAGTLQITTNLGAVVTL